MSKIINFFLLCSSQLAKNNLGNNFFYFYQWEVKKTQYALEMKTVQ